MTMTTNRLRKFLCLGVAAGLSAFLAPHAHARAAGRAALGIIKPIVSCGQLTQAALKSPGGAILIKMATVRETDQGSYCIVTGTIAGSYNFQDSLPIDHWTQRFLMGGFGQASGCTPAMNGEFAFASGGGPGGGGPGGPPGAPGGPASGGAASTDPQAAMWGTPPQSRINGAYLNNHMGVLASKAVIKAFYGQAPKFSYMTGCSIVGWAVLQEAQRFPEDFDGYSVGAPPLYQTVHDLGFWHGWEYHANSRADGSIVLTADKLPILHAAVLEHCAAASGEIDSDLQQPSGCTFNKAWVECPAGNPDPSSCLTPEEAGVAEQLYLGPNDGEGHYFEPSGFPLGSELQWHLSTPGKPADNEGLAPHGIHNFLMPPLSGQDTQTIMAQYSFTQAFLDKTREMQPLYNATNTNLRPLARRGAKMILWQGAEDTTVQPANSISYFEGVQKEMGVKQTDQFLRFFLLPGMGHCMGGDSASQIDTLTPLMSWVEMKQAPILIVAGKPVPRTGGPGGGPGGPPGGGLPNAQAPQPVEYTRPIYPYPQVAKYKGSGDVNDASSYVAVAGPAKVPQLFNNASVSLLGPDSQKFFKVENGQLVTIAKPH